VAATKAGIGGTAAPRRARRDKETVRDRIIDAAYSLFAAQGVAQVGVDKIIAKSGCAKATLYNQFGSKDGLAIAFMERREEVWTRNWLVAEITRRSDTPTGQLLAIFDVFDEWFRTTDFEGCSFINVLLETERNSPINRTAAEHLKNIRGILHRLAEQGGLADVERFAQIWHILMKGSIVAAGEGNRAAAGDARIAAEMVLAGWPREPANP
jgi:AcrR family transcriptional regulator